MNLTLISMFPAGLLDLDGNARPSWHSFRFWGDLPIERVVRIASSSPSIPPSEEPCVWATAQKHGQT